MKPEKVIPAKRHLTDRDRDHVLKLLGCGISTREAADIVGISRSSAGYISQAHRACINQDWSVLQHLSCYCRATVDWAMRVTGTDKVFLEEFPKEEAPAESVAGPNISGPITREDFIAMYATAQDIRNLLVEIRNVLNAIK